MIGAPPPSSPAPPAPPPARVACPLCGSAPMRARDAGKTRGAVRVCLECDATFREESPDQWRLEYASPDLFHPRPGTPLKRVPLLEVRSWAGWTAPVAPAGPTPPSPGGPPAPGLEPGETVRATFAPARIILPQTHTPRHGFDTPGTVWLTDRALRVRIGDFQWSSRLQEVRAVREAAGTIEVLAGPTEEPLHLLLPDPAAFLRAFPRSASAVPA